jgi:transcriptional regulator with XRE-family HTH domain
MAVQDDLEQIAQANHRKDKSRVGEILTALLDKRGMNARQLARLMEVGDQTVSRWMNGERLLRPGNLALLRRLFAEEAGGGTPAFVGPTNLQTSWDHIVNLSLRNDLFRVWLFSRTKFLDASNIEVRRQTVSILARTVELPNSGQTEDTITTEFAPEWRAWNKEPGVMICYVYPPGSDAAASFELLSHNIKRELSVRVHSDGTGRRLSTEHLNGFMIGVAVEADARRSGPGPVEYVVPGYLSDIVVGIWEFANGDREGYLMVPLPATSPADQTRATWVRVPDLAQKWYLEHIIELDQGINNAVVGRNPHYNFRVHCTVGEDKDSGTTTFAFIDTQGAENK